MSYHQELDKIVESIKTELNNLGVLECQLMDHRAFLNKEENLMKVIARTKDKLASLKVELLKQIDTL